MSDSNPDSPKPASATDHGSDRDDAASQHRPPTAPSEAPPEVTGPLGTSFMAVLAMIAVYGGAILAVIIAAVLVFGGGGE